MVLAWGVLKRIADPFYYFQSYYIIPFPITLILNYFQLQYYTI